MAEKIRLNWKLFWLLWISGSLGVVAILPYAFEIQRDIIRNMPVQIPVLVIGQVIQGVVLAAVYTLTGLLLAGKVGLGAPILEQMLRGGKILVNLKRYVGFSVLLGSAAALCITAGDVLFAMFGVNPAPYDAEPVWWKLLLASFYGGVTEEIQLRWFLMTALVWLFSRWRTNRAGAIEVWAAIVTASVIFGLAHLPAASALGELTPVYVSRTIVLNALGGVVFGWLFWRKGLEAAMVAHFSADIVLHFIAPVVVSVR
jgi:membrane protease YdiL (CAAX protease family)